MLFSSRALPPQHQPDSFIPSADVLAYLEAFADRFDLHPHIRYRQHVVRVRPVGDPVRWEFIVRDLLADSQSAATHQTLFFDAVFVCNGHNSEPKMPPYPGRHQYGGRLLHSHAYRKATAFAGRTVLVVGGGPSAGDIAAAIRPHAARVAISHHRPGPTAFGCSSNGSSADAFERRPAVERFVGGGGGTDVRFVDGRTETYTDVIVCTGYKYTYPFLSVDGGLCVEQSVYVRPLFKECINIEQPTMFVLGVPFRMIPFQVVDLQARFCLAHLGRSEAGEDDGVGAWPNRDQMLATHEADMQLRREKYGAHMLRHLHMLDTFQAQYFADLARLGGLEPIKSHVLRIYEESARFRMTDPALYRQQRFRLEDGAEGGYVRTIAEDGAYVDG